MEPIWPSILGHQPCGVARRWMVQIDLMIAMKTNKKKQWKPIAATSFFIDSLHHRPFKFPIVPTNLKKQSKQFISKRINNNWSQIKQPTEATNSALQKQVLPNSSGLKCLPRCPLAHIVSHPPSKQPKRIGVSQPSKLHKIPTAKCAQLQSKEERVGEGGGGTIHLNSQPPHWPCSLAESGTTCSSSWLGSS